ncbi:MAG: 30S ribosomal protein S27ae [Thaumarchaeota archaeon RBG_16_49_8]|nr:MAG: 30S ribosomal protein S27ae [Thaumarchaeota archaeon RBG_16_49_8]
MSEAAAAKKKEKPSPQVWKFYQIEGGSLKRLKKECPRCGRGVFLAEHKDRFTCGKCNYTTFKQHA